MEILISSLRVSSLSGQYCKLYNHTNIITPCSCQVRAWNEFAIPVPFLPYVLSNLRTTASFVWITSGEFHGDFKRRDDYTASRRTVTMHCCIAVSFDVLPAQRVIVDVLPTQRVYPWDSISDRFVLLLDNQYPTDPRRVSMCDKHRLIILERSLSWTWWIIRGMGRDDSNGPTTNLWPTPPPPPDVKRCDDAVQLRQRRQREGGGLIIDRNYNDDGGVGLDVDD